MQWLTSRFSVHSLFFKMLIYFLIVIILLSSYNIWSMTFYTRNVHNEIVKYNLTLIRNTVDSFEKQYTTWKSLLLSLQHNEFVGNINRQADKGGKQAIDYLQVDLVMDQIRTIVTQPFYHLQNVMIYYRSHSFLLESDGMVDDDRMFRHYYVSEQYPYEFWIKDADRSDAFLQALPSSGFTIEPKSSEVELLPLVSHVPGSRWEIIALVNMNSWYESYKGMSGSRFLLLDQDGTPLFQSAPSSMDAPLPAWNGTSEWIKDKGNYYFFEKGDRSGLTYVSIIPHNELNRSISRMNWIAVLLFATTLLIGTLASWFFTRNINRPLKRMITGLGKTEQHLYEGTISEFNAIASHLQGLHHERKQIKAWMDHIKPLLTSYHYMARFKNINIDAAAAAELPVSEGAFMIVVFQLRYRHTPSELLDEMLTKATGKIKDIISLQVQEAFPLSHTLQMDSREILSIVYTQERSERLLACLNGLKRIFDQDQGTYLVTIAVSSVFQHTSHFDQAYTEAMSLLLQAMPVEETQIIWEKAPREDVSGFTAEQEHEFYVNLQAGNEVSCQQLIDRAFDSLHRRGATADQLHHFALAVLSRIRKTMALLNIESSPLPSDHRPLAHCVTPEHYKQALLNELARAAEAIRRKREENYDIIQFIAQFMENHISEEISLELLADKLNMSPTYLSGYIKEKTGSNFSDHLHAIRIRKAKELLVTTNMPVQEVGEQIGYRNVTSFIRMFKKLTGQPPGDYRKTHWIRN
ncbi:helix-turn-helix domain-containing protein [Paenibacillus lactis]|uniref:Transcriptional regulator, AraC family n=1 Tax=Paenibacillus lactis 154 TaxID=743719 RepID=G4HNY4_9BACL|nr:helix-turn-helix domain-containing protein [Paenibacillus lactis]EHB50148.1 transcriptional regulator, AraC family [Paenibacillus lactis 154]